MKYLELSYYMSRQDVKNRFRRSRLGVGWLIAQQLLFAFFANMVWSKIFNMNTDTFVPYFVVGLSIWSLASTAMVEGCVTFVISQQYIKQFPLPYEVYIRRVFFTHVYYFALSFMTALFVLMVFNAFSLTGLLMAVPGILILLFFFYSAAGMSAYLGLRFRDIQHAFSSIFSVLFIVTPIVFPSDILRQKGIDYAIYLNPYASIIEIIRYPLIEQKFPDLSYYGISLLFSIFIFSVYRILSKKWGRYIPFWA